MKTCTKCKKSKRDSMFYKNRATPSGFQSRCKSCIDETKVQRKKYEQDNQEQLKEYRQQHKEQQENYVDQLNKLCEEQNIDPYHYRINLTKEQQGKYREKNIVQIMLNRVKKRAEKDTIPFNLTIEDIIIPTHCPVLDIPLITGKTDWYINSPSLDKINPSLGYVKGNVMVISMMANRLKSNATKEQLSKIYQFYCVDNNFNF